MSVRVVVADDNLIARQGILQLLSLEPEFEVVASCGDLSELLEAVDRERPDVVLTDIRMPPSHSDEGIRVANRLRETHPEVGVVVLSQYAEPMYALALLERVRPARLPAQGARPRPCASCVDAVQAVARAAPSSTRSSWRRWSRRKARAERSPLAELTPREREVLAEIAQGKSNTAIADTLVPTKRAVEKHINSIFMKLGLASPTT